MIEPFLKARSMLAPCLLLFALTGCGGANPVNKINFDRIKSGMTEGDVDRLLGKGKDIPASEVKQVLERLANPPSGSSPAPKADKELTGLKGVRWGNEKKSITVIYRDSRVYKVEQQGL